MQKISKRQNKILEYIKENKANSNKDIKEQLKNIFGEIDRATIVRDLDHLLKLKLIIKEGEGRNVKYKTLISNKLLSYINYDEYFQDSPDNREIIENFNFDIFDYLKDNIFSKEEEKHLSKINKENQAKIAKLDSKQLKKEFERLMIELSWKSSQIEGNTYSLIDTEILLKNNIEASGHSKEEAQMIINHKKALEYILNKKSNFKKLSISKIEDLHKIIVEGMSVENNIRKRLVRITGTKYQPIDNQFQIKDALKKIIVKIEKINHPVLKSLLTVLILSYIQPFEDGNKRTARLLGNAILIANDYCPLSYRSIDKSDYLKATLLFYEQNNILLFKELFIEQFEFSIQNYF